MIPKYGVRYDIYGRSRYLLFIIIWDQQPFWFGMVRTQKRGHSPLHDGLTYLDGFRMGTGLHNLHDMIFLPFSFMWLLAWRIWGFNIGIYIGVASKQAVCGRRRRFLQPRAAGIRVLFFLL
ncbi:hypothetical protein F4775DRAFT_534596 [Biscogniauxia sp. FL1348]|nr:hypothetical protein F4775DRAFT_534596 [Biscogniauxia sp. FL1348]